MTLTVRLDDQDERRLQQIVEVMNVGNQSDAIRKLIEDKWLEIQTEQTFVERRGGHPLHLLNGPVDLSERQSRKAKLLEQVEKRAAARKPRVYAKNTD